MVLTAKLYHSPFKGDQGSGFRSHGPGLAAYTESGTHPTVRTTLRYAWKKCTVCTHTRL